MARWAQKAWTQLKLDGLWVNAGQDLILQQDTKEAPTRAGEGARRFPPWGHLKSVAGLLRH